MLTFLFIPWYGGTGVSVAADNSSIGIKLVDAPVSRRNDPRAQVYIVDHLAPRTVIKRRILITNSALTPRRITVYPGAASIDNNTFDGLPGRATNELTSWISLNANTFDLPAKATAIVLVTIAVAPTASQGEHYGVIWAETSTPPVGSDNITMITRVGIRIYLDVGAGGEPPSDFTIGSVTPARTDNGQPEVLATVHNTGGRALDLAGELSLSDGPGSLNAGPFPVTGGTTLLPGHTAPVQVLLDKQLPNGPWTAQLTLRSGSIEHTVTVIITFPAASGTMGEPGLPISWVKAHLVLVIVLAVALGAAVVLSFLGARHRLWHRHA